MAKMEKATVFGIYEGWNLPLKIWKRPADMICSPIRDSIESRPESVESREEFGHWEVDTVLGSKHEDEPCTVTLVEHKTRKAI